MIILVSGGFGFIGSAVVRRLLATSGDTVVNIDKVTYAASPKSLGHWKDHARHVHVGADVCDADAVRAVFARWRPDRVMHLAAETHVDRSIDRPADFVRTNVVGTQVLLEAARQHWDGLGAVGKGAFRFHHVSTDEVFGALGAAEAACDERSRYDPRSPYAASKAASDHLVRAWRHTYGLPTFVTNTTNNYGPWQFPEKLIPLMTLNALEGLPLPVYGDGSNVRDWIHVDDHAEALCLALERGRPGETYCLGARQERSNLRVAEAICDTLDRLRPDPGGPRRSLIAFVEDRPGHDSRYAMDPSRAERALGWKARRSFEVGLNETLAWYLGNEPWWREVRGRTYSGERLGVGPRQRVTEATP